MYLEIEGAERYRAALYIRLSREDETDGPSESVSNQRAMLEDFARQRGVPVAGLYVDGSSIVGLSQKELEKQAFFDLVQLFFHFTTLTKERMWNMGNLIAVTNFKGGVGKTTTTLNLGAALSAAGKRVLLVDNDPQGNLTAALGYTPPEQKHTLATLLLAAIDYPEDLDIHIGRAILHSETGVDLIGANRRLADAAARLQIMQMSQYNAVGDAECSCETVMATLLLPLRSAYDYIIIDCGSYIANDILSAIALMESDAVLRLVNCDLKSISYLSSQLPLLRENKWDAEKQYKIASNVRPNEASGHIEQVLGSVAFQIPHSEEVFSQVLEGNLLKELGLKESRGFRKSIESITKEVFGC